MTQRVIARPIQGSEDFWRVRNLLVETYPITPTGFNWDVRRWDGRRFYAADPDMNPCWMKGTQLWETEDGRLVGAVHPEGEDDAHLQLHPDYRHLEGEMVAWAEEHLAAPTEDSGRRRLHIFVQEYDAPRRRLLEQRGYEKTSDAGVVRRLRFGNWTIVRPVLADGYILRTTRAEDLDDCQRIADILNAAFGRDFHNAQEYQVFARTAPCFRPDLDLAAEAPDGSFGAYAGVPYDEANRCGIFEPVCTHPNHQRKGLAPALMLEGLHRLKALGAADVLVGTGDMAAANRLYDSIGFTEAYKGYTWRKLF